MYHESKISELVGKTFLRVFTHEEGIDFQAVGETFRMTHHQDCCEGVYVDEIHGDLEDLVGTPILEAREDTNADLPPVNDWDECYMWTFYNIRTIKGSVTIRWYGTSNGYYSVSVCIDRYTAQGD